MDSKMNRDTIKIIDSFLKRKVEISQEYFLDIDDNAEKYVDISIDKLNDFENFIDSQMNTISKTEFDVDYTYSMTNVDIDDIAKMREKIENINYEFEELIENNMNEFELILDEHKISMPIDAIENKTGIIDSLNNEKFNEKSNAYIEASYILEKIEDIVQQADKKKDEADEHQTAIEEAENEIEKLEGFDPLEYENYDEEYEYEELKIQEAQNTIKDIYEELENFYNEIEIIQEEINKIFEHNTYRVEMEELLSSYSTDVVDLIIEKIKKDKPELLKTEAEKHNESLSISSFLVNKENGEKNENNIKNTIKLTKQQNIQ